MGFWEAVGDGFGRAFDYRGRSCRSAYWWWVLFDLLLWGSVAVAGYALTSPGAPEMPGEEVTMALLGLLFLLTTVPGVALVVRRLHDADHSGWWCWISLVPIAGPIVLMVFMLSPGTAGPNRFGPPELLPRYAPAPGTRPMPLPHFVGRDPEAAWMAHEAALRAGGPSAALASPALPPAASMPRRKGSPAPAIFGALVLFAIAAVAFAPASALPTQLADLVAVARIDPAQLIPLAASEPECESLRPGETDLVRAVDIYEEPDGQSRMLATIDRGGALVLKRAVRPSFPCRWWTVRVAGGGLEGFAYGSHVRP